jgi:hypothetical protein
MHGKGFLISLAAFASWRQIYYQGKVKALPFGQPSELAGIILQ